MIPRRAHGANDPGERRGGARRRIGTNQQLLPVGDVGEARPDLLSVDDELIALDPAACSETPEIRPGTGLRKTLAPDDLASEDFRQVIGLLLGSAARDQGGSGVIQSDERSVERGGGAGAGVFLEPDDLLEHRQTAAAHRLRPRDSRPASGGLSFLPGENEVARGGPILGRQLGRHVGFQPCACLASESGNRVGHKAHRAPGRQLLRASGGVGAASAARI